MIIDRTGWSWEYIDDHMDIPRLLKMNKFWRENPPLREMVQAYLGIKIEPVKDAGQQSEQDAEAFIRDFASIGGVIS